MLHASSQNGTTAPVSNIPLTIPSGPTNNFPPFISNVSVVPWIATFQELSYGQPYPINESTRSATSCYMRGLSETVSLVPNNSIEWQWRRVCFTYRGPNLTNIAIPATGNAANGWQRLISNYGNSGSGTTAQNNFVAAVTGILFKGAIGVNWSDFFLAHTDNRRCEVRYDKTRYLKSGNANPVSYNYKMWHGMNKTLVYDDDEAGPAESSSPLSVADKRGMGDYYVIDFFRPIGSTSASDTLQMVANSTLYWHER